MVAVLAVNQDGGMKNSYDGYGEEKEIKYASLGDRAIAVFIDSLIIGAILLCVFIPFAVISYKPTEFSFPPFSEDIELIIEGFSSFVYFTFYEYRRGQTIGKKWMGIKVISEEGNDLTLNSVIIRNIFRFSGLLVLFSTVWGSFCGFIWLLIDMILIWKMVKKQRILDMLAHTVVIKV